jgi:hypothetical protein
MSMILSKMISVTSATMVLSLMLSRLEVTQFSSPNVEWNCR